MKRVKLIYDRKKPYIDLFVDKKLYGRFYDFDFGRLMFDLVCDRIIKYGEVCVK